MKKMHAGRQAPQRHRQDPDSEEEAPEQQPSQPRKRKPGSRDAPQLVPGRQADSEPSGSSSGSEPEEGGASPTGDSSGSSSGEDSDHEPQAGDIPLGQLVALRQDGSTSAAAMKARARALKQSKASFKREGRHRPMEMSSKKPVPVFRETLQGGKREVRDPRFESLSGKYTEERFRRAYSFLYDERLPQERRELKEGIKKVKNPAKRAEMQAQLTRVEQQLRNEEAKRKKDQFERQVKTKEKEAVGAGKRPYYLKKSEKRRLELVAKYEALKASGGLEKYMTKRRKKNAAKDHRYLPVGRRQQAAGGE